MDAMVTTLFISILTIVLSMVCGFVFFLAMRSSNVFIKTFTNVLKEIVMGTPLLVMIFLVVYVFGIRMGISEKLPLGIFALTAYMTPYIANAYETAMSPLLPLTPFLQKKY
jgi:His/Glu/Gln/Arg/opine family amino acid ABC transporter permease subunit